MSDRDLDDTVRTWVGGQLAIWQGRRVDRSAALAEHEHYNATRGSTFLFRLNDGRVSLAPKPDGLLPQGTDWTWMMPSRAELYRGFLQEVLDRHAPRGEGVLAMDMHDGAFESQTAPMFAFQKPVGSPAVLLNEIDAIGSQFYSIDDVQDRTPYADKSASAVFVGGSTGMEHSCASVRRLQAERLRAGLFLHGDAAVDYRLPLLSQFVEPGAEAMMRGAGFGKGATTWKEQFRHKFLLSLDGNGATCSRVAIALKSNGVLVKYNSRHLLHYFTSLEPWGHYIPVARDAEVPLYVEAERRDPGRFASIAERSRAFYNAYLTRDAQLTYAAKLLDAYFASFAPEAFSAGWRAEPPAAAESAAAPFPVWRDEAWRDVAGYAHVGGRGDVQAQSNLFGEPMGDRPLEGLLLALSPALEGLDLRYQALWSDGVGEWVRLGDYAGTRHAGRPLSGLRLQSRADPNVVCQLAASFLDGTYAFDAGDAGVCEVVGSAPMQTVRIVLRRLTPCMSGLAHIAGRGDIWYLGTTQGAPGGGDVMEGFLIEQVPGLTPETLEYRAVRLASGEPDAWTPLGGFAGRRRTGEALTGLEIRLRGEAAASRSFRLHATFVDGARRTEVSRGGEAGIAASSPLESFTLDMDQT